MAIKTTNDGMDKETFNELYEITQEFLGNGSEKEKKSTWVLYYECGEYSDYEMNIEGTFSTPEKALNYVNKTFFKGKDFQIEEGEGNEKFGEFHNEIGNVIGYADRFTLKEYIEDELEVKD